MLNKVAAGINVGDMKEAMAFYHRVLGFGEMIHGEGAGEPITYVLARRDAIELQLQLNPAGAGHSFCYVYVDDVDALYERLAENGAPFFQGLEDKWFVVRDFIVVDPWGNKIGFGEIKPERVPTGWAR